MSPYFSVDKGEDEPFEINLINQSTGAAIPLTDATLVEVYFIDRNGCIRKKYHSAAASGNVAHVDINVVGQPANRIAGWAYRDDTKAWPQGPFDAEVHHWYTNLDLPGGLERKVEILRCWGNVNHTGSGLQ